MRERVRRSLKRERADLPCGQNSQKNKNNLKKEKELGLVQRDLPSPSAGRALQNKI
jgi:hypothetical protein